MTQTTPLEALMYGTPFRPSTPLATVLLACAILGGCTRLSPTDVPVPSTDEQVTAEAETTPTDTAAAEAASDTATTPGDPASETTAASTGPFRPIACSRPEPLVLIDGVRMEGSLADLRPEHIERIEVTKGSAAVKRFGPDAVAGAIEIFLKEEHRRLSVGGS